MEQFENVSTPSGNLQHQSENNNIAVNNEENSEEEDQSEAENNNDSENDEETSEEENCQRGDLSEGSDEEMDDIFLENEQMEDEDGEEITCIAPQDTPLDKILQFPANFQISEALRLLKDTIDTAQNFQHSFAAEFPKLDFQELGKALEDEDEEFFELYSLCTDRVVKLSSKLHRRLMNREGIPYKYTHYWFEKAKKGFNDTEFNVTANNDTMVDLAQRLHKIVSSYEQYMHLDPSSEEGVR